MENEFTRGHTHGSDFFLFVSFPLTLLGFFSSFIRFLRFASPSVCFHFNRTNNKGRS